MSQSPDQESPDQEWRAPAGEVPVGGPASPERPAEPGGPVRYEDPAPGAYGADPYGGSYGAPAPDPYGQVDQYGTAYGSAPPAADVRPAPASTIVLLVISGLLTLTGVGILWAAPAVLAIVSLTRSTTDPAGARRLARIGWWVAAALAVLAVLAVVLIVVAIVAFGLAAPTTTGFDPSTVGLSASLHALHALAVPAAR